MVRDVHDALERALGEQPRWQLDLDDVVTAGRRARRRHRAAVAAGSSAAAVLAVGAVLAAPTALDHLNGTAPARVTVPGPAAAPDRSTPGPASPGAYELRRQAFARAGYDHADAVVLARLWGGGTTPDGAAVRAGDKLLGGLQVPIRHGETSRTVSDEVALDAYFGNGFDYDDALRLAALWHRDPGDFAAVKALAGRRILAGQQVPQGR